MKIMSLALAAAVSLSAVAAPSIANARPHHRVKCHWVVRHHHRVKVCR